MNKFEKQVYNWVKSMPWLKFFVRNLYQSIFDFLPRPKEFSKGSINYKEGFFFGFHDISPFSRQSDKLLANKLTIDMTAPKKNDSLTIGYFLMDGGKFGDYIPLGESLAWNYHKGCRLQWLSDNQIIYNTAINDKLVSKIINVKSNNERIIDFPIDSVSKDGKWASSFSYERLDRLMPGYGYPYQDNGFLDQNAPENSGIFIVNLQTNENRLLVSLSALATDLKDNPDALESRHYVTHSMFSHDGRYLAFLHRWTKDDIRDRTTRLVIHDLEDDRHFIVPTNGMVSHYVWNKGNQILAYCSIENTDSHFLINIPEVSISKNVAFSQLNSDGHQSFISNSKFVVDTYPDRFRMAKIYSVDIESGTVDLILSVYSPQQYQTKDFKNHIACDLHPRVSPDGKYVSFDSVRSGKRSICFLEL